MTIKTLNKFKKLFKEYNYLDTVFSAWLAHQDICMYYSYSQLSFSITNVDPKMHNNSRNIDNPLFKLFFEHILRFNLFLLRW